MLYFYLQILRPTKSTRTDTLFPDTTLARSGQGASSDYVALVSFRRTFREPGSYGANGKPVSVGVGGAVGSGGYSGLGLGIGINLSGRSEEHTSEIQSLMRI